MRCSVQNLHKSQICISKMSINMQKITITRISKSRLILHGEKAAANGKVSLGDRRCSRLLVRSGSKPPSMRPSATELEALEEMSIVVPDTLILEETSEIEAPKAATVGFGVLSKVLSSPGGLREYKNAIENAKSFDKNPQSQLNKALANLGALFAEKVEGRVSTELDPRMAHDASAMIEQAKDLTNHYKEMGVSMDKILMQLPATWEGIQAAKQLEKDGINTVVVLVYSMGQGIAAAQAGVSVIQVNVGRIQDWYNNHPGVIRDPQGPREDSGFSSSVIPGQRLVTDLYNYVKQHHSSTQVMVSGVRTKEDALSMAGCDYLILGPKVLTALNSTPTAQGYNDGLSGITSESGISRKLSPALSLESVPKASPELGKEEFMASLGDAGIELLDQGIKIIESDLERLIPVFMGMSVGAD